MGESARALIGALGVDVTYTETDGESTDRGMMREIMSVLSGLSDERVLIIGRGKRDADIVLCDRLLKPVYDRASDTLRLKHLKKRGLDISYFSASAAVGRECDIAFVLTRGFDRKEDGALFTLAATRARRAVCFVTQTGNEPEVAKEIREAMGVQGRVGIRCPKCGSSLVVKKGRYGEYLGCKKCKYRILL